MSEPPRPVPPRGRRVPRARRRDIILASAEREFTRRGYESASMDEIARRAHVTKALLYQHFDAKRDLYAACAEAAGERWLAATRQQLAEMPPGPEQMRAYATLYFGLVGESGETWQLMFGADGGGTATDALRERTADVVADLLLSALDAAGTPATALEVELLAHALAGAAEQVGRWWRAHPATAQAEVISRFNALAAGAVVPVFRELEARAAKGGGSSSRRR